MVMKDVMRYVMFLLLLLVSHRYVRCYVRSVTNIT